MNTQEKAIIIARLADEQKGMDIQILDVTQTCNFTDFFVIVTCNSAPQLRGIGQKIERALREEHVRPFATAGYDTSSWVVLDYADVVVHLLSREARDYYQLERLWIEASRVDWMAAAS